VNLKKLVVIVPGLGLTCDMWKPLVSRLSCEPGYLDGQTDWLFFDHHIHSFTLGHLKNAALDLQARINQKWIAENAYRDIVMAGHSMGGLLVRYAYLSASGAIPGAPAPASWVSRVSRIVLVATPNSGSTKYQGLNSIGQMLAGAFGLHFAASDLYRGSDFIANLRINWIRFFASLSAPPAVIHLRGRDDKTVLPEDSTDVLAFPNAAPVDVPDAGHDDVLTIKNEECYALLRSGFLEPIKETAAAPLPQERVVFVLHGIRASNVDNWVESVRNEIKRQDPSAIVIEPGYSYFSAARFALPGQRRKNIPWFLETYAQVLAQHRNAEFDFIGHSNGTYILGHCLARVPGMQFKNVVLAGSVLPVDYPWGQRISDGQVTRIRNDRAGHDWPVGILCSALRGLFMRDVGTGGFDGFPGFQTAEAAYFPGGHGAALQGGNLDSIVRYALGGEFVKPPGLLAAPGLFRTLSRSMPYLTFLAAFSILLWWLGWPLLQTHAIGAVRLLVGLFVLAILYFVLDVL
jgi:pimeloyl-ACP methyl ester carboxylesterase